MSEASNEPTPVGDGRDFEREFYTILSEHSESWPKVEDVRHDIFDATLGDQSGIMGDGNVAVLLTCSQRGAVLLSGAVDHWVEHGCADSVHLAMYLLARLGAQVSELLPSFTEVGDYEPFNH